MDQPQNDLEARCQLIWERICRNPPLSTRETDDTDDSGEDDMPNCSQRPRFMAYVSSVSSSESGESGESPDFGIWTIEPLSFGLEAAGLVECAREPGQHWELLDKKVQRILGCTVPS